MKKTIFLFLLVALILPQAAMAANEAIGWIPTWDQALAEARQTNRPILLMSGEPSCGGVPGVW